MKGHVKASSAGSTERQDMGVGSFDRGALATRGASSRTGGSGAPSRIGLLALAAAIALTLTLTLTLASVASASQQVLNLVGTQSGGDFHNPAGVAVNSTGNGAANPGDIYVADEANNRIERFSSSGKFISAWGANVTHRDEQQSVLAKTSGGTYTLTFEGSTTAPIPFDAGPTTVDNALGALPSIGGDANVAVTDGFFVPFTITFTGALSGTDVPQMTADTSGLTGANRVVEVDTLENGSGGHGSDYEVCTTASACGAGVASSGNGTAAGDGSLDHPVAVAVDADTGNVYVSDGNNFRIDEYDGAGGFIASFGWDVDADEPGTGYEVCPAAHACKKGVAGAGAGQLGDASSLSVSSSGLGIAVSPPDGNATSGTVFLADAQNRRVGTYDLDGASPSSFGSAAVFGTQQPRRIAVDSRGIVYASNNKNGGEVERYDSENANGGGTVFLAPIEASFNERETIAFSGFTAGERYTLTCPNGETTPGIEWTPFANDTLNRLAGVYGLCGSSGDFSFAANPSVASIEFRGTYAGVDIPQMTCTKLSGSGGCTVTTEVDGETNVLANANGFPESATVGLAVNPDSDGGGPDADVLYVLRSGNKPVIQQLGPGNAPGNTVAPAASDDNEDGNTSPLNSSRGLGINEASGGLLVPSESQQVRVLGDPSSVPAPVVTVDPITTHSDTTATLSGSVQPNGALVSCDFEYSTDQSSWTKVKAEGARSVGNTQAGSALVRHLRGNPFEVGQPVTASNGAIPTGTVVTRVEGESITLSQPATATTRTLITKSGCDNVDPTGGAQSVTVTVAGLHPNTQYTIRLAAARPYVQGSTVTSAATQIFTTDSTPPVIADVGAVQVSDTSARLVATIDPRNSSTGYVFQYGTTPALGSSTAPLDIGGGNDPITISQVVPNLAKDTTYYFRAVATNLTGTTSSPSRTLHTRTQPFPPASPGSCSNESVRQEQGTTHLPDCRAFEMVSPPDKNQGNLQTAEVAFSRDGEAAAFCTPSLFGEPSSQQTLRCAPYVSRRTGGGWTTSSPFPRYCNVDTEIPNANGILRASFSPLSFDRLVLGVPEGDSCQVPPISAAAPRPSLNLYRQDLTTEPFGFALLTPNPAAPENFQPASIALQAGIFAGGDDDFSTVVYRSTGHQTSDAPPAGVATETIYDWEEAGSGGCTESGGCLNLVAVDPAGNPFTTASAMPVNEAFGGTPQLTAVSANGDRIYFVNKRDEGGGGCLSSTCDLYMREDNSTTLQVSASECSTSCGVDSSPDVFAWANPAGNVALFTSCAKLTDASAEAKPCDTSASSTTGKDPDKKLYRWDRNGAPGHRLVDLSVDKEPNDGIQPHVYGLIGASDDGNTVFFVARGQVVSGASTAPGLKLYRWRWNDGNPAVDYLAPYVSTRADGADKDVQQSGGAGSLLEVDPNGEGLHVRVTPDGQYLMIQTRLRLDPAADGDSDVDVYRWDEADGWLCVSCQLPGVSSMGNADSADIHLHAGIASFVTSLEPEHSISADGRHIFFETPDRLLPADINGESGCPSKEFDLSVLYACSDVYEWNDGTLSLLSSGTSSEPTVLRGATGDGRDVFLLSYERFVGWDVDNGLDLYDVRTGGGSPEPPAQPAGCEGEACRGEATAAPNVPGAGTGVFEGPGNPSAPARKQCRSGFVRRHARCVRKAKAHRHTHKRGSANSKGRRSR